MEDYVTIYDLKRDKRWIDLVQNASLNRDDCGLVTQPALFGSSEWWALVGTDKLPIHIAEGVISRVYMSGHNDFLEFELDDGKTKKGRMRRGDDAAYTVGRKVRLRYVEMKFKTDTRGLGNTSECVLTIEVGIKSSQPSPPECLLQRNEIVKGSD